MQKILPSPLTHGYAGLICISLAFSTPVLAQEGDDAPIDIDFGSTRIGGEGLTDSARRASAYDPADEEIPTEENIPKVGSAKRLPHLHILAKRYTTGSMWKEACARYDQIIDEAGDEGLASTEDGKKLAGKSFLKCGEQKAVIGQEEAAERLLQKSVRHLGKSDYRHESIRYKMLREAYRKKVLNRDIDGALIIYKKYQAQREDEDERIWLGEKLSQMAEEAYKIKDKDALARYIEYTELIAPRNPVLRRLKKRIKAEETAIPIAVGGGLTCLSLIAFFSWFGRWRGRKRIEAASGGKLGKKNKYLVDD